MTARPALLGLLALGACDACPRPDPVGAGPDLRAEVRAAVNAFYDALGPTRICVTRIDLDAESPEREGYYAHGWQGIGVDGHTDLGAGRVVTHELCHALDDQHGVGWEQDNLWRYDPAPADIEASREMVEAFADTCEVGPLAIQLVGDHCEGDVTGSRAYKVLQRWFPIPDDFTGTEAYRFEERGTWTTHMPVLELDAAGMRQGQVRFDLRTMDGRSSVVLDIASGQPGAVGMPEVVPEVVLPDGWVALDAAGTAEDALVIGVIRAANGGLAKRLLAVDGTGVQSLGCVRPGEVVFASGGRYSAWAEDAVIHWGEWLVDSPPGDDPVVREPGPS